MINVTIVITTLNEQAHLARCLKALLNPSQKFDEIIVLDSNSTDRTVDIAREHQVRVESFQWNGQYPKKRQWFLDHIETKHDYIFFVDADEEVTSELIQEIEQLDFKYAGYFVKGQYYWKNKILRYGLQNNKLALFDKNKVQFPVVDDLYDFSMGEIEGHYQPVLKKAYLHEAIGQIKAPLKHFACEDYNGWRARHKRYGRWEAGMIKNEAYPKENNKIREVMKYIFRKIPLRGEIAFLHSYIYKFGFLDGLRGFEFALSRRQYYQMVSAALKTSKAVDNNA